MSATNNTVKSSILESIAEAANQKIGERIFEVIDDQIINTTKYADFNQLTMEIEDNIYTLRMPSNTENYGTAAEAIEGLVYFFITKEELVNEKKEAIEGDIFDFKLSKEEITYGINGYPSNLGDYAIFGFNSLVSAQLFADKHKLEVCEFKIKDGWGFWQKTGSVYSEYSVNDYLNKCGDNYTEMDLEYANSLLREELENVSDKNKIEDIKSFYKKLITEIENLPADKAMIWHDGDYETIDRERMRFSHDTWTYAIGVLFPKNLDL